MHKGNTVEDRPDLYNGVKSRVWGLKSQIQEDALLEARKDRVTQQFDRRRSPQASSNSTSPYLMSNCFNLDVTEIFEEVKAAKTKKDLETQYAAMDFRQLRNKIDGKNGYENWAKDEYERHMKFQKDIHSKSHTWNKETITVEEDKITKALEIEK